MMPWIWPCATRRRPVWTLSLTVRCGAQGFSPPSFMRTLQGGERLNRSGERARPVTTSNIALKCWNRSQHHRDSVWWRNINMPATVPSTRSRLPFPAPLRSQDVLSRAEFAALFNAAVNVIMARLAVQLCFGYYAGRPLGKRSYSMILDQMMEYRVEQLVLEFANRELAELPLCREISRDRELAIGLVDVKSYYLETPEDVAERIRQALE